MLSIKRNNSIDTLRGISVFLVLIFHLKIEIFEHVIFEGGYLGVDIFFVISGYLITSILFLNSDDKKFTYKNFLKKRFLRIFPTYISLIFATLLVGYLILTPNQLIDLANSAIASILFISNVHFWKVLNDYFFSTSHINTTLLHTWSLSIEIQYYLFISLIFIFLKKISLNPKIYLMVLGILSFLISFSFSIIEPSINFFGFQSRLWEFILGSFIFFYKDKINLKINLISKYIIYLIIFTFVSLAKETTPSLITLIFLIFVSILILNKNTYKESLDDIFFNFFGLISYSLYIWHYPIISISELIFFKIDIYAKFFMFLSSICIGFISFKFIEKKLKYDTSKTYFIVFFLFLISLVLIASIKKNDGFPERMAFNEIYDKSNIDDQLNIKFNSISKSLALNSATNSVYDNNFLIIGNSHSIQAYEGFVLNHKLYRNLNFNNFHIQISCFDETIFSKDRDECKGRFDFTERVKFLKGVENFKNSKYILLITRWTNEDLIALPNVVKFLKSQNKKIIIFNSITDIEKKNNLSNFKNRSLTFIEKNHIKQNFQYANYLYLNKNYPSSKEIIEMEKYYYLNKSKHSKNINDQLKNISKKINIPFFNLNKFLCDDVLKRCKIITDKKYHIWHDVTGHMTLSGSLYLFKIISNDFMQSINDNNFLD